MTKTEFRKAYSELRNELSNAEYVEFYIWATAEGCTIEYMDKNFVIVDEIPCRGLEYSIAAQCLNARNK